MGDAREIDGKVVYCFPHEDDEQLKDALDWMGRNFSANHNPSAQPAVQKTYLFYYLYALERVGRLSGQRFLGDSDWYRDCLLYTSPSPRDATLSRMPSSA